MRPEFPEMFQTFGRIGLLSFGGPAAQIALMHRVLVDEKHWLEERQFLSALGFCSLLPGPEAMQLATYAGWRLRGTWGGLLAGLLFVLPGALVMLALSLAYVALIDLPWVAGVFLGIKAAVVIVVIEALIRISKRALKSRDRYIIAALSFAAIYAFGVPFPLIITAAAFYGAFFTAHASAAPENAATVTGFGPLLKTVMIWGGLWALPLGMVALWGPQWLLDLGFFFSKLAVVTFGGAYAVLAYMAQTVVTDFGWVSSAEMMDALGLAETTPGPLILVTQFVGHLAGQGLGGITGALLAMSLTLWVTFVPCFLWIFAGAPYIDAISRKPRLNAALGAITAAVVGVILNLSIWFGMQVFFSETFHVGAALLPDLASIDLRAIVLALISGYLLLRLHQSLFVVLAVCALGGLLFSAI